MTLVVSRDYVVSVGEKGDVYASVERVAITILVRMYLDVFGIYFTFCQIRCVIVIRLEKILEVKKEQ